MTNAVSLSEIRCGPEGMEEMRRRFGGILFRGLAVTPDDRARGTVVTLVFTDGSEEPCDIGGKL